MISHRNIVHNLENAEMTLALCDDLVNFSFDNLWNVKDFPELAQTFPPLLIECLKRLVCYHIYLYVLCIFIQ
jgi:hypothetical protein